MTSETLAMEGEATPEWLTQVLQHTGYLSHGTVITVESEHIGSVFNSQTQRLHMSYSSETPGLPTRFVLKRNTQEDWCKRAQAREVLFYQTIAHLSDHPKVLVPCYAAAYDEESKNSYILMLDVSETHREPITRAETITTLGSVPQPSSIEAVIDTLAMLQAYWWEHPLLKTPMARADIWETQFTPVERYVQYYADLWAQVLELTANAPLPEEVRSGYEACLKLLPRLWEKQLNPRFSSGKQLTLIHGDAYFSNFLVSRQQPGPTYLIDWQSPQVHIGGEDLANLMATFWTRAQRQEGQREQQALRRFYQTLTTQGVNTYSWSELLRDYRLGIIDWLFMPVWDATNGSRRDYWWPKMHCLFQAFQDWECLTFMAE